MPRALAGLLAAIALAGCAGGGIAPGQLQAWVGRPAKDLVEAWGPATREVTDGPHRVLIYEELERAPHLRFEQQVSSRDLGYQAARAIEEERRGPAVYARSYLFWVDAAGTIVRADRRQP